MKTLIIAAVCFALLAAWALVEQERTAEHLADVQNQLAVARFDNARLEAKLMAKKID
jgi:hypothetical protein